MTLLSKLQELRALEAKQQQQRSNFYAGVCRLALPRVTDEQADAADDVAEYANRSAQQQPMGK